MNQYTPNNRPSYPWVSINDDFPCDLSRVFAVWTNGEHKLLARSYSFDGIWSCLEYPQLNKEKDWYVIYWQYAPELPDN